MFKNREKYVKNIKNSKIVINTKKIVKINYFRQK